MHCRSTIARVAGILVVLVGPVPWASAETVASTVPPKASAPAPDDLSGHVIVAPRLSLAVPMGSAEKGFSHSGYTGTGPNAGLDLAIGISRYVAIQGRFDAAWLGEGGSCPSAGGSCSASTMAFGLGVEYHLVNGASLDPWIRVGAGYRLTTFDLKWPGYASGSLKYHGVDWLHLAVGGEWYAHPKFGFGPYLALDVGYYGTRPKNAPLPPNEPTGIAHHTFLSIGVRGVFDPMR